VPSWSDMPYKLRAIEQLPCDQEQAIMELFGLAVDGNRALFNAHEVDTLCGPDVSPLVMRPGDQIDNDVLYVGMDPSNSHQSSECAIVSLVVMHGVWVVVGMESCNTHATEISQWVDLLLKHVRGVLENNATLRTYSPGRLRLVPMIEMNNNSTNSRTLYAALAREFVRDCTVSTVFQLARTTTSYEASSLGVCTTQPVKVQGVVQLRTVLRNQCILFAKSMFTSCITSYEPFDVPNAPLPMQQHLFDPALEAITGVSGKPRKITDIRIALARLREKTRTQLLELVQEPNGAIHGVKDDLAIALIFSLYYASLAHGSRPHDR